MSRRRESALYVGLGPGQITESPLDVSPCNIEKYNHSVVARVFGSAARGRFRLQCRFILAQLVSRACELVIVARLGTAIARRNMKLHSGFKVSDGGSVFSQRKLRAPKKAVCICG